MGAAGSIQQDGFARMKDEYEAKKAEGLTDEQLFDHMKTVFDGLAVSAAPAGDAVVEEAQTEAAATGEAAPAEESADAQAEAPAEAPAEAAEAAGEA